MKETSSNQIQVQTNDIEYLKQKIKEATLIVSIGFDLIGISTSKKEDTPSDIKSKLKEDLKFNDLKKALNQEGYTLKNLNDYIVDNDSYYNKKLTNLEKKNIKGLIEKNYVNEFYLANNNDSPDPLLLFLHYRRNGLLTRYKSDGTVIIELMKLNFPLNSNNPGLCFTNINLINDCKLNITNKEVLCNQFNNNEQSDYLCNKTLSNNNNKAYLNLYLMVKTNVVRDVIIENKKHVDKRNIENERLERIASLIGVIRVTNNDAREMIDNISNIYINLDIMKKYFSNININEDYLKESGYLISLGKSSYIRLDHFMIYMAWKLVAEPLRKYVLNNSISSRSKKEFENRKLFFENFMDALDDLKNYIMAYTLSIGSEGYDLILNQRYIKLSHNNIILDENEKLAKFIAYVLRDYLNLRSPNVNYQYGIHEIINGKVDIVNNSFIYRNWIIYFYRTCNDTKDDDCIYDPEKTNDTTLDIAGNSKNDKRKHIAWFILLLGMASILADTFIVYNDLLEDYAKDRMIDKESIRNLRLKKLNALTLKASVDFSDFYDVNVISRPDMRSMFEELKDSMLINEKYDSLKKRLEMFAEYEGDATSARLTTWVAILTAVLAITSIVTIILEIFH